MERLLLHLRVEQKIALAELSRLTGAPIAEHIRRAIDMYLNACQIRREGKHHERDS